MSVRVWECDNQTQTDGHTHTHTQTHTHTHTHTPKRVLSQTCTRAERPEQKESNAKENDTPQERDRSEG